MKNAIALILFAFAVCVNAFANGVNYVYEKVTSEAQLVQGATYIIVNDTYGVVMGYQKSLNRAAVTGLTFTDNTLTLSESQVAQNVLNQDGYVYEFQLLRNVGNSTAWLIHDIVNAQPLTIKTSGNTLVLKGSSSTSDCYSKISISDAGDATVEFYKVDNKKGTKIRFYNATNDAGKLFSCYGNTNQPVQLYRKRSSVGSFTITSAGYGTFYTDDAYYMPTGVTGYTVTQGDDGLLSFNKAYEGGSIVPAKTAILIQGEAKTYEYGTAYTTDKAPEDNLLHGSSSAETTHVDGATAYYALSTDDDGANLGFYWMSDNGAAFTNGAHKAYLAITSESQSQMRAFVLPPEISSIKGVRAAISNARQIYDINGRRVSPDNARRGLYIVNGKKTLLK